jgi:hypothetical protein
MKEEDGMTERDWEAAARTRLQRSIDALVARMRATAEQVECEAKRNLESSAKPDRDLEFQTYAWAAGRAVHELHALVFNANAANIIDAASDADTARQQKIQASTTGDPAAMSLALYAMLTTLDGWVDGARMNHDASGHRHENKGEECWRHFTPADVRVMVNDAAREVGISEFPRHGFPLPKVAEEDK